MFGMYTIISRHRVFTAYLVSLLWLAAATLAYSLATGQSFDNLWKILTVLVGGVLTYVLAWMAICTLRPTWTKSPERWQSTQLQGLRRMVLTGLVLLYTAVVVIHFAYLGAFPILDAARSGSDLDISIVRQKAYLDLPVFMRYASDYSVKALGPALLLLTYYFRSRLFWAVLAVGIVYSFGLFARILPVILFLPLLTYQLMQRRWLHFINTLALMIFMLVFVTTTSSITLRGPAISSRVDDSRRTSIVYTLYERTLIVPGRVMDQWFHYYREPRLREQGCGYRLLAPLLGCTYVHVPTKLYAYYYRENVELGMQGSLNAASFMTEFANFGSEGLVLAALFGGLVFMGVMLIYRSHPLALPMNLPLIVCAMENNLFTAINSGAGWLVMTFIFIYFFVCSSNE